MNKVAFIKAVAAKSGVKVPDVKEILEAMQDVVFENLSEAGEIQFMDLGKLKKQDKPAGTARNPMTGETIEVAAKTVVKFRLSKKLKDSVL